MTDTTLLFDQFCRFTGAGIYIANDDACAVTGERECSGSTDAGRGTCYQYRFSGVVKGVSTHAGFFILIREQGFGAVLILTPSSSARPIHKKPDNLLERYQ
jgi:hypothetical protein